MAGIILPQPLLIMQDGNGDPISGGKAEFFLTGTTTPSAVYQDSALTTPHTNPVIADADGIIDAIFLDRSVIYKLVISDAEDNIVRTVDPVNSILPGEGDVVGPASATDENIVVFDGATGKVIKDSGVALSDKANASHNHAASDINSGTLAHERGGLEADVSAYSGLVKISGGATSAVTAPTGTVVGTTDTQTLTNKTINLANNTVTGTKSGFNTACSDDDFAFLGSANTFTGGDQSFERNGNTISVNIRRTDTAGAARTAVVYDFEDKNDAGSQIDAMCRLAAYNADPTAGSESGEWQISTRRSGSSATRLRIGDGLFHSAASGGDKGNNTINYGAVYDDNSLLSCYPFDQYLDGKVDLKKWDSLVPDKTIPAEYRVEYRDTGKKGRDGKPILEKVDVETKPASTEKTIHEFARKFLSRIGTEYDPLTLDGYAKHWKDKRHLPAMPNEAKYDPVDGKLATGAWVQRLVETSEVQAVLIEQLNQITKAQEARIAALEATVARLTARSPHNQFNKEQNRCAMRFTS